MQIRQFQFMPIPKPIKRTIRRIKSLRSQPAGYPELLWAIFVFLGGAVNAVAIRNFVDWFSPILQYLDSNGLYIYQVPNAVVLFIIFGVTVVLTPIGLSFLLTRFHPKKRIVPPLWMQIIAFALLLFFVYNKFTTYNISVDYLLGFYAFVAGLLQDGLIVFALGRTAYKENVIKHSFIIYADIKEVNQLITSKQFLERWDLRIIQNEGCTVKLKLDFPKGFQLFLELKEGAEPFTSILNIVACDIQAYSLGTVDKNSDVYDWAMGKIDTLRGFFKRKNILVAEGSESEADLLVGYVMDEMEGSFTRLRRMTARKRRSIYISLVLIAVSAGLFVLNEIGIGVAVLAIAVALITDVVLRK
jgi:hypothetical protein